MAQQTQDAAIIERRLRPIYDAFELSNSKKALHEAEKVLKKTPNLRCAKALKGLALLRLGKTEESHTIIDQIVAEKPTDDSTLQVLFFIFKELEQYDKICVIFQNAADKDANNEEILSHLFMAYVRLNDFQSQQKTALQLYKLKSKNPYYCWVVMSCVLKALRGPESKSAEKSKLMLELAQKMMEKLINDGKLDAEQEVQLYLIILEEQRKYKEAWEFLSGPTGTRFYPGAPVTMKINLLKKLERWAELNVLLKELLKEDQDRWDFYKEYIESVSELTKSAQNGSLMDDADKKCDTTYEMCNEYLCEIIESVHQKLRGPYLGRLELHRIMAKNDCNATELLGDFVELLIDYFRTFGDKPCCARDVILFSDYLDSSQQAKLLVRLQDECKTSLTILPQSIEEMQKHVNLVKISRACGAHIVTPDNLMSLATTFSLHYEYGFKAFERNMLPTDIGISDSYVLLAVHVMYDLARQLNSSSHLLEALCVLNYLLTNSPSNFHAKLLCMQIYHRMGCAWAAHKSYESLGLKFIQLDSMGYLHCAHLAVSGIPSLSRSVHEPTLKFFANSQKEGHEYLSMCYKYGSFSKLQEFMDFQERLLNSHHYLLTMANAVLLEIVTLAGTTDQNLNTLKSLEIDSSKEVIQWDKIRDNRDLSVIVRWDPYQNSAAMTTNENESFKRHIELLQIRWTLICLIVLGVESITKDSYAKNVRKDPSINKTELLEQQLMCWSHTFSRIREAAWKPSSDKFLADPIESRLYGFLQLPYEEIFRNVFKLVLSLENPVTDDNENTCKLLEGNISQISKLITESIERHNSSSDVLWDRRKVQETVSNGIEILSVVSFVFTIVHEKHLAIMKPTKRNKKKSYEKIVTEKEQAEAIASVTAILKTELKNVGLAIDSWKSPFLPETLIESLAGLSLDSNIENSVKELITKNHEIVAYELRGIVREKLRMLNLLSKLN